MLVTSQPTILCSSWEPQPLGTSKPRYLEQLENYLRKELLLLDLGTDSEQELRLQVRATDQTWQGWRETHASELSNSDFRREMGSRSSNYSSLERGMNYDRASGLVATTRSPETENGQSRCSPDSGTY